MHVVIDKNGWVEVIRVSQLLAIANIEIIVYIFGNMTSYAILYKDTATTRLAPEHTSMQFAKTSKSARSHF